uniref:Uncharacterized protein n=1 Tax=Anopheles quadriannulatus TaxID=34691 RepID=A0A182XSV1_ANOQN
MGNRMRSLVATFVLLFTVLEVSRAMGP